MIPSTIRTANLSHLAGDSLKAATRIVERIASIEPDLNLEGVTFLSGEEWRNRGETLGENAVLVLIHESQPSFAKYFSYDACYERNHRGQNRDRYQSLYEMAEHLRAGGFLPEPLFRWATAVEPA
jgi:hypothetical protein|tara:strand:+ start:455 stop:829 length:375 start_codon:yes stop_codon:yes gene_type:complete